RKVTDATTGPQIHGEVRDFITIEKNTAGIGTGKTYDNVEGCCLSCAVGPEEPYDFTLSDEELDVVHVPATAIRLAQLDSLELQHTSSFLDSVRRQSTRTIFRVPDDRIIPKIEGQLTPRCCARGTIIKRRISSAHHKF